MNGSIVSLFGYYGRQFSNDGCPVPLFRSPRLVNEMIANLV
jgi:hypothetical protein